MKKIIFVMVLLLFAAPAWADVVIECAQVGETNEVTISYDMNSEPNLIRGFGLDVTVTDGNIIGVGNLSGDYWVYPGSIDINDDTGEVDDNGTPVGDPCRFPDTLPGLDTNGVTLEMGSLYVGVPNAPDTNGTLLSIYVDSECTVNIAGNEARTGASSPSPGLVFEDPCQTAGVLFKGTDVNFAPPPCFSDTHDDYEEWGNVNEPNCWCYTYQCYGDADGLEDGDIKEGYFYVEYADLTILLNGWKADGPAMGDYTGDPYEEWICADFSRSEDGDVKEGYYRVEYEDMTILLNNWRDDSGLAADCGGNLAP